jgi:VanZ family protein
MGNDSRPLLILWAPVALYMAMIFGFSAMPSPPAPPGPLGDKATHAVVYFGLSALIVRALAGGWWKPVSARMAILAAALATVYGATDEIHQSFVPPRQADRFDLLADAAGAGAAALVCAIGSRLVGLCRHAIIRRRHGL